MSVLRRELDAYQRALAAYRRRYGAAVREQNQALRNLQEGQRYLVPTDTPGQYLIAKGIDAKGNFDVETEKKGGILGIGAKRVPRTVGADSGIAVLPAGPTPDALGDAPRGPDASLAQARAAGRPSLAEVEAGLIGQVMRGKGVRQGGVWYPPESLAAEMARQAQQPPTPIYQNDARNGGVYYAEA